MKADVSKQLGLAIIPRIKNTKTINQELKIGVFDSGIVKTSHPAPEMNFLGIGKGKQKQKKQYGKMGQPTATLIQEARNRILAEFPFEKSKNASSDDIQNMISKVDVEINNGYTQVGEPRTSAGRLIGNDYKGNGSCGNNIECVNKAVASIGQWEKRRSELEKDLIDAQVREQKEAAKNPPSSGAGAGTGNKGLSATISNPKTKLAFGIGGALIGLAIIIAIIKKVRSNG